MQPRQTKQASKLAFGTAGLMGAALTDKGRLSLLSCAYDNNIRHFDTAPLYGQGDAESVLGKFASNKRENIIIATKFGLRPQVYPAWSNILKPVIRRLNRARLDLKRKRNSKRHNFIDSALTPKKFIDTLAIEPDIGPISEPYCINELRAQTQLSLKKLQTDYLDILWLHDTCLSELTDEFVIELEQMVMSGQVLMIGVASSRARIDAIHRVYPQLSSIQQVPVTAFEVDEDSLCRYGARLICHSVFSQSYVWLNHCLESYWLELCKGSRNFTETFPNIERFTSYLVMARAIEKNPTGTLLFSSSKKSHIIRNALIADQGSDHLEGALTWLKRQYDC